MYIVTLITKRSSREIIHERQFLPFVTKEVYTPGSVIEIIDGNKKSPAFVVNSEPVSVYKQELRMGALDPKKLRLSKTGPHAGGMVIQSYPVDVFTSYLTDNSKVKESDDEFIRSFFPIKKTTKNITPKKKSVAKNFSEMNIDQYFNNKPAHHSRMHELVDTVRSYFGEQAISGQGSFSYYLGFFKKIPNHEIQRMFEEAKRNGKDLLGQKKAFWWKIGQYIKEK